MSNEVFLPQPGHSLNLIPSRRQNLNWKRTFLKALSLNLAILIVLAANQHTNAETPEDRAVVASIGDKALIANNNQLAIDQYSSISDPTDKTMYNLGIAYYRIGNLENASQQFRQVIGSQNDAVAASARFNLGNARYAQALKVINPEKTVEDAGDTGLPPSDTSTRSGTSEDIENAIKLLQAAITQYRSSLRIMPTDEDARANIELAQNLIEQLQDQQQQDQQQQDQQQQDQQQQDQQQQDQQQQDQQQQDQQQQDQQQQDQQQQDQQQQDQQQQDQQQQDQQQQDQQQQDQQQQDQQQQDQQQQDQQQQDQQQQDQQQQDQQQQDQQQQDQQQQEQQQPQSAEDRDRSPTEMQAPEQRKDETETETPDNKSAGELTAVNEQESTPEQQTTEPVAAVSDQMTEEEARKLLQSIRDRDMLRRLRKQAAQRALRVPVERDW